MCGVGGKICGPSPERRDSATVCLSALSHSSIPCFRTRQGLLLLLHVGQAGTLTTPR